LTDTLSAIALSPKFASLQQSQLNGILPLGDLIARGVL
jgi:hypothetical protein